MYHTLSPPTSTGSAAAMIISTPRYQCQALWCCHALLWWLGQSIANHYHQHNVAIHYHGFIVIPSTVAIVAIQYHWNNDAIQCDQPMLAPAAANCGNVNSNCCNSATTATNKCPENTFRSHLWHDRIQEQTSYYVCL